MSRKIFNILTKELIQKAKEVKSAEELKAIAKENGVGLSDEQAADMFSKLNTSGELADDELASVVGGWCSNPYPDYPCDACGGRMQAVIVTDGLHELAAYYKCNSCGIISSIY